MSDKPTASRSGGKLYLNESAETRVRAFAQDHDVEPAKVLADVRRGLPAARLLLRLMEIELASVRIGRPADDEHFRQSYFTISRAVAKHGDAKGFKMAAAELGITVPTARDLHRDGVARAWFQATDGDQ